MSLSRLLWWISRVGAPLIAIGIYLANSDFVILATPSDAGKPIVERDNEMHQSKAKVLLGDSVDMERLSDSNALSGLKGNPVFGLYLHETGMINLWKKRQVTPELSLSRLSVISNQIAEITIPLLDGHLNAKVANEYFNGIASAWSIFFLGQGFNPTSCNVNGLDVSGRSQTLADWASYARILAQHGLFSCGSFGDPNNNENNIPVFSDSYWNFYKEVALIMGGVALDTPPTYALNRGDKYIEHVADVVKWARSKSMRVSIVLAPYNDGELFIENVRKYTNRLSKIGAIPTEWVIGGYEDGNNNRDPILHLSSTSAPLSLNGSARWLLDND